MRKSYLRFEEYRCAVAANEVQAFTDLSSHRLPFATNEQIDRLFTCSSFVKEALSGSDEFRCGVYYDLSTEKFLIAFAGTDIFSRVHWDNNTNQWAGLEAEMYERGVELIGQIKSHQRERVLLTGHSLGGGIATLAAAVHRVNAIVFNPPGIHVDTLKRYGVNADNAGSLIRRFVVHGEILDLLLNRISLPLSRPLPMPQLQNVGVTQKIHGSFEIFENHAAMPTAMADTVLITMILLHPSGEIALKALDLHKMEEVFIGLEKWCDSRLSEKQLSVV